MNIAVLSDIHGSLDALSAVLLDMDRCGVQGVIVLGDILFPGDSPQECFNALKALAPLAWVRGNTDDWLNEITDDFVPPNEIARRCVADFKRTRPLISDEAAGFVAALPERQTIEIGGILLLCVHGSDRRINEPVGIMRPETDIRDIAARISADILLCGHTHSPYIAEADGKLIINAGSVSKPKDSPGSCYCLLRLGSSFEFGFRKLKEPMC